MSEHFKTLAVVNPRSANGRTGKNWPRISDAIEGAIGTFDHKITERPMEAADITKEAIAAGYEMIVSVGGDGNNNEVVNGFFEDEKPVNRDAVFAVFPGGTGGDLARILNLRGISSQEVADTLRGRESTLSDAGIVRCTGNDGEPCVRHFINIADLGIGGEAVDVVNRTTKAFGGRMSFLIGSFRTSLKYKNRHVKYSIDGGPDVEGKFYMIAAALGKYFGGGMQVAPLSVHNDGLFDFMILGDLSFWEGAKLGIRIYSGKHIHMPKIERVQGKKLIATSDETVLLDIDGEQPGRLPAEFEILPASIRMKQLSP